MQARVVFNAFPGWIWYSIEFLNLCLSLAFLAETFSENANHVTELSKTDSESRLVLLWTSAFRRFRWPERDYYLLLTCLGGLLSVISFEIVVIQLQDRQDMSLLVFLTMLMNMAGAGVNLSRMRDVRVSNECPEDQKSNEPSQPQDKKLVPVFL